MGMKQFLAMVACVVVSFMQASAGETPAASWADNIKLSGSVRARYELYCLDNAERHRLRVQGKLGVTATINEQFKAGISLVGDGNATSTNTTLGSTNNFNTINAELDQLYLTYTPKQLGGDMDISFGKFQYPWWTPAKTELVWDGDLKPEGVNLNIKRAVSNELLLFGNVGLFILQQNNPVTDDNMLGTAQVGATYKFKVAEMPAAVKGAVGFYYFDGMDEVAGTAPENWHVVNVGLEANLTAENFVFGVVSDFALNVGAENTAEDTGVLVGVTVKNGKWKGRLSYHISEEYAVHGDYASPDFTNS